MKSLFYFSILISIFPITLLAQKPLIDTTTYQESKYWPQVRSEGISNDGKYFFHTISNLSTGRSSLVIQSANSVWKKVFIKASFDGTSFCDDNKHLIFQSSDTLFIVRLNSNKINTVLNVESFKFPVNNKKMLSWRSKNKSRTVMVRDLITNKDQSFSEIDEYLLNDNGTVLLLIKQRGVGENSVQQLFYVDLSKNSSRYPEQLIWEGKSSSLIRFNKDGTQMAFVSQGANKLSSILYFKQGGNSGEVLLRDTIDVERMSFTDDGASLLLGVKTTFDSPANMQNKSFPNLNVWNYKDDLLQSQQLVNIDGSANSSTILYSLQIKNRKFIQLHKSGEYALEYKGSKYVIVVKDKKEAFNSNSSLYLVNISTGSRTELVNDKPVQIGRYCISPDDRFVIYYDTENRHYLSYEINTEKYTVFSTSIPFALYDEEQFNLVGRHDTPSYGVAGWLNDGTKVLLYDRYDIWSVDPKGILKPINLTNQYGRRHEIVFSVIGNKTRISEDMIDNSDVLLLAGFNRVNKTNGFWELNINNVSNPVKGIMDGYCYYIPRVGIHGTVYFNGGKKPLKARDSNAWLIYRENAAEYPNLFFTRNFKNLKQVSDLAPQKKYNWISSELITWEMTDGRKSQGILYKPENFDSSKSYPLIFNYYDKRSDELNRFLMPDYSFNNLNIPTYVSNGYLVFVPDIYFKQKHNGQSVVNATVSAAKYLSTFHWVDSTKLGLQGHSFGGWQTNFLITHCNIFAAACEASGTSDHISAYGQLTGTGEGRAKFYEFISQGSPYGFNVTPFNNREVYIENSPIFFVNNVTTPLLMMHGRLDGAVPFAQALEMFLNMKRAGKKVWLLDYEDAVHSLTNEVDYKDYTIRMRQFFEYYLKGEPAPLWMTRGIPAVKKRIDVGLELDSLQLP